MSDTTLTAQAYPQAQPVRERAVVIVVALASVLAPLNSTMIAIALPGIMDDLSVPVTSASWLITAYLIAMASLQPVTGKLGDRFGRRNLILGGLIYFCVVSLGAALAPSFLVLLFCRIQQGISGAIIFPNGSALLREVVPASRRAARFGLVGAAIGVAAACGPPLGGLLVGAIGWPAIFYVNLPIILPALWLGWRVIPAAAAQKKGGRFDVVGAFLLSATLIAAAWLLTHTRNGDPRYLLPGGVAVLLLAVGFLVYEARQTDPVLQPRLFRHRSFAAATATVAFSNLAMYTTLLVLPLVLAQQNGWSALHIGLALTALSAFSVVFTPLGGRLADRWGRRWPTVIGMVVFTLGVSALTVPGALALTPLLLCGLSLAGVGLGISSPGLQTAAIESVAPAESGVAAGVFSTGRYLGSITGSSVLAGMAATASARGSGYGAIFAMIVAAAMIATVTSLGLHDRPSAVE